MALLEINFLSQSLLRPVTFTAILPCDKLPLPGQKPNVKYPLKTLYLLHGIAGNDKDFVTGTRIRRWAEEKNLAVIMPAGENNFYTDKDDAQEYYGRFIGEELVKFTRTMFPLSDKREDTFIAGLSMGGYGAILNGLKYSDTFGYIGGFSTAVFLEDIAEWTNLIQGLYWKPSFYDLALGKRETLLGGELDLKYVIEQLLCTGRPLPRLYLAIGTEDFLYERNQEFRSFLTEKGIPFTYEEGPGGHDWDFWDTCLKRFIDWLPLEEASAGMSSGNVSRSLDKVTVEVTEYTKVTKFVETA